MWWSIVFYAGRWMPWWGTPFIWYQYCKGNCVDLKASFLALYRGGFAPECFNADQDGRTKKPNTDEKFCKHDDLRVVINWYENRNSTPLIQYRVLNRRSQAIARDVSIFYDWLSLRLLCGRWGGACVDLTLNGIEQDFWLSAIAVCVFEHIAPRGNWHRGCLQ